MPRTASTTEGGIEWTYDASGRTLRKLVGAQDAVSVDYVDGIEYLSDGSVAVNGSEGRTILYDGDNPFSGPEEQNYWQTEYVLRDHSATAACATPTI